MDQGKYYESEGVKDKGWVKNKAACIALCPEQKGIM